MTVKQHNLNRSERMFGSALFTGWPDSARSSGASGRYPQAMLCVAADMPGATRMPTGHMSPDPVSQPIV